MQAVFEGVNGTWAVFVVDEVAKTFHIKAADLPSDAETGDVFEVEIAADDQLKLGSKLPNERQHREKSARAKREALLKHSRNKR